VLACAAWLVACKPYDPDLLPPPGGMTGGSGGASGMDASVQGGTSGDGGPQEGGVDGCSPFAVEACNRNDDDCDGKTDEDVREVCELTVMHADTQCVPLGNTARCVLIECRFGYENCDGDPANGCEPFCVCNLCADAGTDDAGE
jgi:hypothetical protein